MVIQRGEIWWASLNDPVGSAPGYRRPVLVIQSNEFNQSQISTIIAIAITSNTKLAQAPGNVFLSRKASGLTKDSVINVSQVITIDKKFLTEYVSSLPERFLTRVEEGLRLVLSI